MRNGVEANRPRPRKGTGRGVELVSVDECSSSSIAGSSDAATRARLRSLEKANLVRIDRAQQRHELERGRLDFDEFLDEPPESCLEVPIVKALTWLPNIGRDRARAIIASVRHGADDESFSQDTRIRELSSRAKYLLYAQADVYVSMWRRSVFAAA